MNIAHKRKPVHTLHDVCGHQEMIRPIYVIVEQIYMRSYFILFENQLLYETDYFRDITTHTHISYILYKPPTPIHSITKY